MVLRCRIRAGTPSSPNTPVLMTNPTGTRAGLEKPSSRSQCETSNPGAMKSTSVARKAMGGKASEMFLRGRRRIIATAQESKTSASGDFG